MSHVAALLLLYMPACSVKLVESSQERVTPFVLVKAYIALVNELDKFHFKDFFLIVNCFDELT